MPGTASCQPEDEGPDTKACPLPQVEASPAVGEPGHVRPVPGGRTSSDLNSATRARVWGDTDSAESHREGRRCSGFLLLPHALLPPEEAFPAV